MSILAAEPISDPIPHSLLEPIDYASPTATGPRDRYLQTLVAVEAAPPRWLFALTAAAIAIGFFFVTHAYWAPAHPGVDQNGYLVGGRIFAKTLSTGYQPASPFHYVGAMWVMSPDGWVYPKYPLGVPILTAICFWIGGEANGPLLAYYVAPICGTLAVLGMFFLARQIAGSFAGLLAELLLATNTVMLTMTNNPWSHAPAVGFVVWGMCALLWWWRYDGLWRAAIAGFLLGYAVLIRYTEGLLLLPMAVVCLSKLRWSDWRSWLRCAVPLIGWLVPVIYLLAFNKLAMGTWTGYDTTNESTGFDTTRLADKWRGTLDQLYDVAAYFILPLGLLGMLMMFRFSWRTGLFLLSWFFPGVILYTAYYWGGGNMPRMGYMRFFLTLLPPLIASACWTMASLSRGLAGSAAESNAPSRWTGIVTPLAAGAIVALCCSLSVIDTINTLERDFTTTTNLSDTTDVLKQYTRNVAPADVVLFCDGGQGIMNTINHVQFATGFEIYSASAFSHMNQPWMRRRANDSDAPDPIQPRRREYLAAQYAKYSEDALTREQNRVVSQALSRGKRVFALLPEAQSDSFIKKYVHDDAPFKAEVLAAWNEPVRIPPTEDRQNDRRRFGGPDGPGRGGPGGPPPGNGPGGGALFGFGRRQDRDRPVQWQPESMNRPMRLLELKRK